MTIGAIVYLAQARHSSYGRDSLKLLHASVESLFRHYNGKHHDDVLFLHFGDVNHTAAAKRAEFVQRRTRSLPPIAAIVLSDSKRHAAGAQVGAAGTASATGT